MIMIQLNAGFDDGFVIAVPAFLVFLIAFRFIIGSGESISYPNELRDWLKAVLLIDDGMRMSRGILLELPVAIPQIAGVFVLGFLLLDMMFGKLD